jgi:hypothetical protein
MLAFWVATPSGLSGRYNVSEQHAVSILRAEVLTAVEMKMLVFYIVTPSGLQGRYQSFGATCCLHLQGRGSQGSEDEDVGLLHCNAVWTCR